MQLTILEGEDVGLNLALEDLLFRKGAGDAFLIWRNRPAVVCGAYQNIFQEVDVPLAQKEGVALARRSSGGGTVYHDLGNVNYSVILHQQGIQVDFSAILQKVCRSLGHLGLEVSIDQTSDLIWQGKKISGNAQKKSRDRVLHHGTLLFACDLKALSSFANGHRPSYASKATPSRPRPVTNLCQSLGGGVQDTPAFIQDWVKGLRREWDLEKADLPPDLIQEGKTLADDKYRSWEWTYAKSPPFRFRRTFARPGGLSFLAYEGRQGRVEHLQTLPPLPELAREAQGAPLRRDVLGPLCERAGQGLVQPEDFF